jgi:hypothetical protein
VVDEVDKQRDAKERQKNGYSDGHGGVEDTAGLKLEDPPPEDEMSRRIIRE